MRVVLLYPPPWRIPSPGETPEGMPFGPPRDSADRALLDDGDFREIPYGLLTLAAEVRRAGHQVALFNLAAAPWREVEALIATHPADLFGISAFTSNRRGLGAIAALIRRRHPHAHITAGGPFVTALPEATLRRYPAIDTAVVGEGEATLMELLDSLAAGRPAANIRGLVWRDGDTLVQGTPRPAVANLDSLAQPFDYDTSRFVITSRGCPSKCTFCGSATTWGAKVRFHSVERTLETLTKALERLAVPFIAVKDDTFTANRKRALAICDAIIDSGPNFLWSCDTRVDSLSGDLLRRMRLAGCQMISLGVESGSPRILASIRKRTTNEMVLEATRAAHACGINVRWYMILGNRGETRETVEESVGLIRAGRPDRFIFSPLSFYPGTEEWEILRAQTGLSADIFFDHDFREPSVAVNRQGPIRRLQAHLFTAIGAVDGFERGVADREAVVERFPGLHAAHLELANAYYRAGRFGDAEDELDRAADLGFPIPAMIANQRACIALAGGDSEVAALLQQALADYRHPLVAANLERLRDPTPRLDDSVLAVDFSNFAETQR